MRARLPRVAALVLSVAMVAAGVPAATGPAKSSSSPARSKDSWSAVTFQTSDPATAAKFDAFDDAPVSIVTEIR